jgi:hypothetical protein
MKKSVILIYCSTLTLFGCSDSNQNSELKSDSTKDTVTVNQKTNTETSKKVEEIKKEEPADLSPNGIYKNIEGSKLKVSNFSEQGFNFSYTLKGGCDGFEDKGLAVFTSKNTAVQYSEDGTVIVSFSIQKDGSIEFGLDLGMEYFGMDCIRGFDSNFTKK